MGMNVVSSAEIEQIKAWENKDVYFLVKYFFNITLTPGQEEIVRAIAYDEVPRITICCVTRYGKSLASAIGLLLWTISHANKRIRLIAPTEQKTAIIREYMIQLIMSSTVFMRLLDIDKTGRDRIKKELSRKRMTWKNGVDFRVLTADKSGKGETLMGWGGDKIWVEEIGEMPAEIWPKIQRMLADSPDSTYGEIGNPWNRDGPFYQHWTDPKWKRIHIDYKQAIEEKRFTKEFIEEVKNDPLMTSLEWQVLWEANFPTESEDQLIPYQWVEKAQREIPEELEQKWDKKIIGVDVARFGKDLNVFTYGYRRGTLKAVKGIISFGKSDTMTTTGRLMKLIEEFNPDEVIIDTDGLGAGVTDRIRELVREKELNIRIIEFHGGVSPSTEETQRQFENTKSEAFFKLRADFEKGNIIIPEHPTLISQLGKIKWKMNSSQKKHIIKPGEEGSDDKSPDFAASLCYWAYETEKLIFM